jgi:radical SAM superfamily enzyme YgiQ (UPF0313 family)
MRVLLVQPGVEGRFGSSYGDNHYCEPLALEIIAASLPGHEVRILDMSLDGDLELAVRSFSPEACGIPCSFTYGLNRAVETALRLKELSPDLFIFAGGIHATLCPQDLYLACFDAVVLGEGEETTPELIRALEEGGDLHSIPGLALNRPEGQVLTPAREGLVDLDRSPLPSREQVCAAVSRRLRWRRDVMVMGLLETSRGCPYRCKFCSMWRFHKGLLSYKSAGRVVQELADIPYDNVIFVDDNFLANASHAAEIGRRVEAAGIKKRYHISSRTDSLVRHPELIQQWRRLGCVSVALGLEAIEDEELRALNKRNTTENNLRALEILKASQVGFSPMVMVPPDAGRPKFQQLRRFMLDHYPSQNIWFSVLTPLPGTELWEEQKDKILYPDYDLFDCAHAVTPTRLPLEEFYREYARLFARPPCASSIQALRRLAGTILRTFRLLPPHPARKLWNSRLSLRGHRRSFPRTVHGYQKQPLPAPSAEAGKPVLSG